MELTMNTRREIIKKMAPEYQKATKKEKRKILNELVHLTGYTRTYASWLLSHHGRKVYLTGQDGKKYRIIGSITKVKRNRKKIYDEEVLSSLKKIWLIFDCPCGKRLAPSLPWMIKKLEKHEELVLSQEVKAKLLSISPATIDRLLQKEKRKFTPISRSYTKPGTLLKHQVPVRTFADWDEKRPGFCEIDLVAHDGGNPSGDFCQTLDVTDVLTGWTETQAVKNKAQKWVFEALEQIRAQLPFPLLGIDSDNGGEFINHQLIRYCQKEQIVFTRSRPSKKNDNCYVEQKNWTVVRKTVGYCRYETEDELLLLNQLYSLLRLYTNFFQPVTKLVFKERVNSKVKKHYDEAKTPLMRVLDASSIDNSLKQSLKDQYEELNPAELKRQIVKIQNQLIEMVTLKNDSIPYPKEVNLV
ncbi:transposase family protein [Atrimonas thermophila]|uniref:integrase catalytic domain-containing protein n=1 Tax=Atrimonas thermophila TaxID=3064161 RepID=UPI00399C9C2F